MAAAGIRFLVGGVDANVVSISGFISGGEKKGPGNEDVRPVSRM